MNAHGLNYTGQVEAAAFQQEKQKWENAIVNYMGPDPLDMWFNFIYWYEQNAQYDTENLFESALGKCLSTYECDARYNQDVRMVKLWMKYIDLKPNPLNLYQVLYQRGIGTQCSLFYIGWAHYYDSANAFKQAESVYNLGFQAKSQPFRDLEEAHKNFRLSIAQRMLYDDSQSKKRTVSQLTDQRQQITALKPATTTPMSSSSINNSNGNGNNAPQIYLESNSVIDGNEDSILSAQVKECERTIISNSVPETNDSPESIPVHYEHNGSETHDSDTNGYLTNKLNTISYNNTSTASAISSSLNSVYGGSDQTTENYSYDEINETAVNEQDEGTFTLNSAIALSDIEEDNIEGVKLPPNFVRYAKNHDEPWMGALFLDEPDALKICKYQRSLVYPGTGEEFSPEEIRSRKYAHIIESIKEQHKLAFAEKEAKLRAQHEHEERMRVEQEQIMKAEEERLRLEREQQLKAEQERLRLEQEQRMRAEQEQEEERLKQEQYEHQQQLHLHRQQQMYRHYQQQQQQQQQHYQSNPQSQYHQSHEQQYHSQQYYDHQSMNGNVSNNHYQSSSFSYQQHISNQAMPQPPHIHYHQSQSYHHQMQNQSQHQSQIPSQHAAHQPLHPPHPPQHQPPTINQQHPQYYQHHPGEMTNHHEMQPMRQHTSTNGYDQCTTYAKEDDFEEQIEASTILLDNGQSKPQKITIKFRKEKPLDSPASGNRYTTVPSSATTTQSELSTPKPKKSKKTHRSTNKRSVKEMEQDSYYGDSTEEEVYYGKPQPMDDASLLQSLSNVPSSSNDSTAASTPRPTKKPSIPKQQPSFLQNDESFSNSEFAAIYGNKYSANENGHADTNGTKRLNFVGATSTPVRQNTNAFITTPASARFSHKSSESSSKSSTPRNTFKSLRRNASNTSLINQTLENDDSMTSFSMVEPNSFFETEHDDELKQQRLDKALKTIDQHLQRPHIDPFNSELCKAFLTKVEFPSREHQGKYKLLNTLLSKLSNTKVAIIGDVKFFIEKEVGRGAYGSVYRAVNSNTNDIVALKFQKPPNLWELYICTEVDKRIKNQDLMLGFMDISSAVIAPNASIFVSEFSPYGSLLDINNRIRQATTKVMHESLVMHFTSQILKIVHHLHSCQIIHGDIKPDNFLLMKIPNSSSHLPTIRLIDFGCAIDMKMFEPTTQFKKIIQTDGFTCPEMLEGRPWTYQTDIFCIAGTVHVMLFGEYMQTVKKFGQNDIKLRLPRYLKKHIWTEFFSKFLNISDIKHLPDLLDIKGKIDDEAYGMESELQTQIRTLSNILHKR